jgi:hypothetical protein
MPMLRARTRIGIIYDEAAHIYPLYFGIGLFKGYIEHPIARARSQIQNIAGKLTEGWTNFGSCTLSILP